jgi:hypothetical protein
MRPHHLPRRQLIRPVPRYQVDALLVVLERLLDHLKQRVCLVLVDAHVVTHGENDLADLFLFAVLVVLLIFVEADGDVDACFSGPCLWELLVCVGGYREECTHGVDCEPIEQLGEVCLENLAVHRVWDGSKAEADRGCAWRGSVN